MIPTELNSKNYDEYIAEAKATCQSYHASSMNCLRYGIHSWAPRCWFSNIHQFFRNIHYAYQRAIHGYCSRDVWCMDNHLMCLIADMLTDLANHASGYPGCAPYDTYEKWQVALYNAADLFRKADTNNELNEDWNECEKNCKEALVWLQENMHYLWD